MAIEINNASPPRPVLTPETPTTGSEKEAVKVDLSQPDTPVLPEEKQTEEPALEDAVSNINDFVQNIQRSIHFSISEDSGRTIIKVYDAVTDELIREIPSEELQRISKAIDEQLSSGLLLKVNI